MVITSSVFSSSPAEDCLMLLLFKLPKDAFQAFCRLFMHFVIPCSCLRGPQMEAGKAGSGARFWTRSSTLLYFLWRYQHLVPWSSSRESGKSSVPCCLACAWFPTCLVAAAAKIPKMHAHAIAQDFGGDHGRKIRSGTSWSAQHWRIRRVCFISTVQLLFLCNNADGGSRTCHQWHQGGIQVQFWSRIPYNQVLHNTPVSTLFAHINKMQIHAAWKRALVFFSHAKFLQTRCTRHLALHCGGMQSYGCYALLLWWYSAHHGSQRGGKPHEVVGSLLRPCQFSRYSLCVSQMFHVMQKQCLTVSMRVYFSTLHVTNHSDNMSHMYHDRHQHTC